MAEHIEPPPSPAPPSVRPLTTDRGRHLGQSGRSRPDRAPPRRPRAHRPGEAVTSRWRAPCQRTEPTSTSLIAVDGDRAVLDRFDVVRSVPVEPGRAPNRRRRTAPGCASPVRPARRRPASTVTRRSRPASRRSCSATRSSLRARWAGRETCCQSQPPHPPGPACGQGATTRSGEGSMTSTASARKKEEDSPVDPGHHPFTGQGVAHEDDTAVRRRAPHSPRRRRWPRRSPRHGRVAAWPSAGDRDSADGMPRSYHRRAGPGGERSPGRPLSAAATRSPTHRRLGTAGSTVTPPGAVTRSAARDRHRTATEREPRGRYEALYTTRVMCWCRPDKIPMDVQARILDVAACPHRREHAELAVHARRRRGTCSPELGPLYRARSSRSGGRSTRIAWSATREDPEAESSIARC